jgi:molybdopterin/thiamine biosynthesis adenylyltransferase
LSSKSVTLIGLGAIGSRIAESLGRAGVGHFTLCDPDFVEPGNIIRGSYTLPNVGHAKVEASVRLLAHIAPETLVDRIGGRWDAMPRFDAAVEFERVVGKATAADALVFSAADYGLALDLQESAVSNSTTFVYADVTQGAWGGKVFVYRPGEACLGCLYSVLAAEPSLSPTASPEDMVLPTSCDLPTFTGLGLDIDTISSLAARATVQELLRDIPDAYPATRANYLCWQGLGTDASPSLTTHIIPRNESCVTCHPPRP